MKHVTNLEIEDPSRSNRGVYSGTISVCNPGRLFKADGNVCEADVTADEITGRGMETSPYGIFRYKGFFEDGLGKDMGRMLRRVRNKAAERSRLFGARRKGPIGELFPGGFRGGSMSGLSNPSLFCMEVLTKGVHRIAKRVFPAKKPELNLLLLPRDHGLPKDAAAACLE